MWFAGLIAHITVYSDVSNYTYHLCIFPVLLVITSPFEILMHILIDLFILQAVIAGGGLDVEMFNRGMQPLAYNIKTKNMGGVSNRYLDGIYLLFTYVTKPEAQLSLQKRLNADDDIIRSTTFRLKA
jgi:ribosomal protein S6